jgi:dsRNA-specific ribonuclease
MSTFTESVVKTSPDAEGHLQSSPIRCFPTTDHRSKRNVFSEDDIRVENKNGKETLIYDPYNPVNKMITPREIETMLQNYGINVPINHFELYKRAFIHRSYTKSPMLYDSTVEEGRSADELDPDDTVLRTSALGSSSGKGHNASSLLTQKVASLPDEFDNTAYPGYCGNIQIMPKPYNCLPLFTKSNERLEFVGDGVLECITKFYLYRRFPKENEGFMTEKKIALVKNEAIGRIAYEMGLHKWFILSKNTEEKQTRTNLKKLGCLFESFLGALFLDFNKIKVHDEDGWFDKVFLTGPGFQMVQIFVENVFEKHVNWIDLIRNDDNYKNILQVKIQKAFKVTPDYLEVSPYSNENGYYMGVYLCLGQSIHGLNHSCSIPIQQFVSIQDIHNYMSIHGKVLVFLGEGKHKIKKKAEQIACESAVQALGCA